MPSERGWAAGASTIGTATEAFTFRATGIVPEMAATEGDGFLRVDPGDRLAPEELGDALPDARRERAPADEDDAVEVARRCLQELHRVLAHLERPVHERVEDGVELPRGSCGRLH